MKKLLFILPMLLLVGCGNAQATNNSDVVEKTKKVVESTTKAPETTKVVETTKEETKKSKRDELYEKYNGKTYEEIYKIGGDGLLTELANADLYAIYDSNHNTTLVSKEEITKELQKRLNAGGLDGFTLDSETKKIYEQLKNNIDENQKKEESAQVSSLIVRLQTPKSVDQIGGNKVGDNAGMYKGQIQQPRKYGTTPYPGSGLFACNSLLGENAENFYECRNGFVVLKAEGFKIFDKLTGKDRNQFSKTEREVFKINNPNIKIVKDDFVTTYDYGTFSESCDPMWLEGFNQCVVNYLGQSMFQTGKVIEGVLTPQRGYATGCSNPSVVNADGTFNQAYTDEVNAFWHDSARDHSQEAQNALIRKYMK